MAADRGFGPGQAERAYKEILREGRTEAFAGGGRLVARARIAPIVREMSEEVPEGTTTKFVQRLDDMPRPADTGRAIDEHHLGVLRGNGRVDHLDIESVIIPMIGRTGTRTHTLCVSSQIGCAMGCGFCETAQMGLVRSLTAEEIVGQWWAARHIKGAGSGIGIDNIVFMGMGEPLDNAREVIRAIEVLTDRNGPGIAMSRITISTVGRVDGLRLLDEKVREHGWHRLGLAVSVNAPNDEVRDGLMPINKKYDMAELRDALMNFRRGVNRMLCFEYVLIPGVNDTREHARQLAAYLEPFKATEGRSATGLVNVIPYNPRRDSPWPAPEEEDVTAFIHWLGDEGLYVKRRRTKGRRMMGACGQLGTAEIRGRKLVGVTIGGSAAEEAAC
ncbi:MAG: 23S rRNA (adenine(2503)-C(2))-methyltransferase RlmN [Planctomycetota bacterium]